MTALKLLDSSMTTYFNESWLQDKSRGATSAATHQSQVRAHDTAAAFYFTKSRWSYQSNPIWRPWRQQYDRLMRLPISSCMQPQIYIFWENSLQHYNWMSILLNWNSVDEWEPFEQHHAFFFHNEFNEKYAKKRWC